jgi:phosphocarrier protein
LAEQQVLIQNKLGLHARASASFAVTASSFASDVALIKDDIEVNGKSIMGIMMLAACKGTLLRIRTDGPDAEEALKALVQLVDDRFGEGE